ncbi:hypothetical protein B0H14DRAFT_2556917 [Mycena olivaceomarginata]|nr:hypothetical protein B0H14DRAFT_2556917 [Mycena olivaceomarginata]
MAIATAQNMKKKMCKTRDSNTQHSRTRGAQPCAYCIEQSAIIQLQQAHGHPHGHPHAPSPLTHADMSIARAVPMYDNSSQSAVSGFASLPSSLESEGVHDLDTLPPSALSTTSLAFSRDSLSSHSLSSIFYSHSHTRESSSSAHSQNAPPSPPLVAPTPAPASGCTKYTERRRIGYYLASPLPSSVLAVLPPGALPLKAPLLPLLNCPSGSESTTATAATAKRTEQSNSSCKRSLPWSSHLKQALGKGREQYMKPPLACLFCRGRKIACGPPVGVGGCRLGRGHAFRGIRVGWVDEAGLISSTEVSPTNRMGNNRRGFLSIPAGFDRNWRQLLAYT